MTKPIKAPKPPEKTHPNMVRLGTYTLNEVLDRITDEPVSLRYGDVLVWMHSDRYWVFKYKGTTCVRCGLAGTFFALEYDRGQTYGRAHFNLYGIDADGDEVLMTKDHIIPISKGGPKGRKNCQPMCNVCNGRKGNELD